MTDLPFIPLAEPWLPPACAEAVRRQVASTFVGPGAASVAFGTAIAEACGVHAAVPVASGTTALSIALQVLGLQPGDEVIVPAYGVISVINAVAFIGLIPRLCDIDRATGNIDPACLENAITDQTKAVVFVDFGGSIGPDLDAAAEICSRRCVLLVEDAAWALGRGSGDRRGGAFGDIGCTSFSVPKLVTTGQGGAVLVHDEAQREAAVCLSDQGDTTWRQTNITRGIGANVRLSDVAAALGLAQIEALDERIARKARAHAVLDRHLGSRLLRASDGDPPMQNVVFLEDPGAAIPTLRAQAIAAARPYRPFWDHPPYAHLKDRDFPAAEFWGRHAMFLPFGIGLSEDQADRVGRAAAALNGRFLT